MKASECKCCVCEKQAVAFYPIDMAKAVWPDDKGKQILTMAMVENAREEYKQTK